jgi:hypothetical protein
MSAPRVLTESQKVRWPHVPSPVYQINVHMLYLSQSRTKDLTYQVNGASKPATDQRSSLLDSLGGILLNFLFGSSIVFL